MRSRRNPKLLGWRGVRADRLACTARIEGRLPEALRGTFYRNGPAVHERFGVRYQHLFDGDGMVQAFRFDGRGVTHHAHVLATPKLSRETGAGRRLYSGFGTPIHDGAPVRRPDDVNTANISVLDHHGELLALWEAGSASVLDRESLAWRGFKVWGKSLEGLPFTAHPKVEPDGTLWAFGLNLIPRRAIVLYHISADGTVVKAQAIDPGPIGMVHDFVVTARSLVIVIPPLVYEPDPSDGALLDGLRWRPALGTRVLVVDKDDFNARRWYQLPAGFGFHHGNGWEDAGGVIRFDHCVAADPSLMTETMRGLMRGELNRESPEYYTRFTLHPDGRAEVEASGEEAEFPRIAPDVVGRRNRFVYTLGVSSAGASGWRLRRVVKRDLERGTSEGVRLRLRRDRRRARVRASEQPSKRGRRLAGGCVPRLRAGAEWHRRVRCPTRCRRPDRARVARLSPSACVPWRILASLDRSAAVEGRAVVVTNRRSGRSCYRQADGCRGAVAHLLGDATDSIDGVLRSTPTNTS